MTTCGYFWCWVIIVLCIIGVTVSAVRGEKSDRGGYQPKKKLTTPPPNRGSSIEPAARAFRRGGARYVTCSASTRLDDGYIVSMGGSSGDDPEKMLRYAKKELAAILAEQALAAGGIEFTQVGGELRAAMRTVTGREETPSTAEAVPLPQSRQAAGDGKWGGAEL